MKDVGNIFEKLKFAVDYLQETDYELESIAKKKKIQTAGAEGRNACR